MGREVSGGSLYVCVHNGSRCEADPIDASRTLSERQVQEQREAQTVREAVPDEQQERPVDRPGRGQQLAGFEQ